jgi:hypothetical protein
MSCLVFLLFVIAFALLWIFGSTDMAMLFMGIMSTFMFFHLSFISIGNMANGNKVDPVNDLVWKLVMIILATMGFMVYIL